MGTVKGSAFDFHDQGIFYLVNDFGARATASAATNNTKIQAALAAMNTAGGGVLIIPHGINHSFNPATDFPSTANNLVVWLLTGNQFILYSNHALSSDIGDAIAAAFFTTPSAVSFHIVDANPATYTYRFEVYNNAGSPVITGSSFDLCTFLPGGTAPVAAFARAGSTPGRLFLFQGLDVTGTAHFANQITQDTAPKIAGQTLASKSIQSPATGTTINMAAGTQNLILDISATIAALTINLPPDPSDGNIVNIFARSAVTALTLGQQAGTVTPTIATGHGPTTLAALASFELIYNSADTKWYRRK